MLLRQLINEYTLPVVHSYMAHIRKNAADSVRSLLKAVAQEKGTTLQAVDYLDDGSPVNDPRQFASLI
jgi:5-oxoprolinase (ATP-hydrolysing)